MSDQLKSERLAYEYMMKRFEENGDREMVKKVSAAPPGTTVPLPGPWMSVRDEAMHALGIGTTHDMRSVISGIFLPVWQERAYTLGEKVNIWRGKWSDNSRNLWNQMMATNITIEVPKLDIPVYFLHGIYDYTVSYAEAKSYFDKLQAPRKGFYTFDQSAHSPIFEEPDKTRRILKEDVLAGVVALADP